MTLANRALERKELIDDLELLVKDMDVPEKRCRDFRWLIRNLGIRNSEHPQFKKALHIIRRLCIMSSK